MDKKSEKINRFTLIRVSLRVELSSKITITIAYMLQMLLGAGSQYLSAYLVFWALVTTQSTLVRKYLHNVYILARVLVHY